MLNEAKVGRMQDVDFSIPEKLTLGETRTPDTLLRTVLKSTFLRINDNCSFLSKPQIVRVFAALMIE